MPKKLRSKPDDKRRTLIVKKQSNAKLVDRLTFMAAVLEPLITLPQVYEIFHQKTAAGVSISSWVGYEILTLIWLWYGIVHSEKLVIIYQGLFSITMLGVIIGAIMYGGSW